MQEKPKKATELSCSREKKNLESKENLSCHPTKLYQKVCKNRRCQKEFEHASRNKRYCSTACEKTAKTQAHGRQRARRDYQKNKISKRASSLSRKQAREFAINETVKTACVSCGEIKKVGSLECHHRDGDHFNNDVENLALVCKPCHAKLDVEWRECKKNGTEIPDCRKF